MGIYPMTDINISIVGIGNYAGSLIQSIYYYNIGNPDEVVGLMHWDLGGYRPGDIKVMAAFDIDQRKVGKDVNEAIFAKPNCTKRFCNEIDMSSVVVQWGRF